MAMTLMQAGSRKVRQAALVAFCLLPSLALLADIHGVVPVSPGLAVPVSQEEIEGAGLSIYPDGTGLPTGSGNAFKGEQVYLQYCISCHGPKGEGGSAEPLAGGIASLDTDNPEKTVGSYWPYATTLFAFNRYAMPMQPEIVLDDDQAYAVTAYILYLNGLVGWRQLMDKASLPCVQMPNISGFDAAQKVPEYVFEPACRSYKN
ncbi:MAG: c-type cytochrome [Candidatus Porifericomitaceae bacterium WSBS_2022_MAG_OTU9]